MSIHHYLLLHLFVAASALAEPVGFDVLTQEYGSTIQPIIEQSCIRCHNTEKQEADLDLERFAGPDGIRQEPRVWQKALFMLENNEMPPKKSKQLTADQKTAFLAWIHRYLDAEAHAGAGDPGRVILRRLSNAEYDNTIRDLTGIDLELTREFPADSAAGEGFTNSGESMVMSPALLDKYLDAAREIASHVVFLGDGFRFSAATTNRDQADEVLDKIAELHNLDTEAERVQLPGTPAPQFWSRIHRAPYFRALIEHRDRLLEDPSSAGAVAREYNINAVYFGHLTDLLVNDKPSAFLARLQARLLAPETTPDSAEEIAAGIKATDALLWNMKTVSQRYETGLFPTNRTVDHQELRAKMPSDLSRATVTLSLGTGDAGDGSDDNVVIWENPRFEKKAGPPLHLRDVQTLIRHLDALRHETFARSRDYLDAVAHVAKDGNVDLAKVAAARELDEDVLRGWLAHLNIRLDTANAPRRIVEASEYMLGKQEKLGGKDLVNGRIHPEGNPSVLVNAMYDKEASIGSELPPRSFSIHPSPSRYGAVGWSSPTDGMVRVQCSLRDAATNCGNGIAWALNLTRGPDEQVLAAGEFGSGGRANPGDIDPVEVRKGDLIALLVGPRAGDHGCDATLINLVITKTSEPLRSWNMSADVIDDILVANPFKDRYGNEDVWHIYTGAVGPGGELGKSRPGDTVQWQIPEGSLLARWRAATLEGDTVEAERLAIEATTLFTTPPATDISATDHETRARTLHASSPLFRHVSFSDLVKRGKAAENSTPAQPSSFGLPADAFDNDGNLVHRAPQSVTFSVPTNLVLNREFVATARLAPGSKNGSAQVRIVAEGPAAFDGPAIDLPFLTREGTPGHERAETSLKEFRDLFPRYLCCRSTVPVDETVTLVMFHREDSHLSRLMLTEAQRTRLDELWQEVHYISHDAIKTHEYFPLIMAFSTQVGHEYRYVHLEEPIRQAAEEFEQHLVDTQPAQIDALIEFAGQAFRQPLEESEEWALRAMYATLRADEETHEDAFRTVLARVLSSPNFLYRIEEPGPGKEAMMVTNWELATRLSYFLWSTTPDEKLLAAAADARLHEPEGLVEETRRMLRDDRVRGLATEFACQWLGVRGFDAHNDKNERQYPTFGEVRDDMYEETIRFFEDLFRRDGPVLEIIDADHTFVNGALAKHYQIDGITGEEWQRVDGMRQKSRGGVLGMATVLSKQSGATRTSPVLRGFWVVETLLGERLPNPPATVPELPDALSREGLTVRQMTEKHVSEESCAGCHVRIDPYGFALESFDAIGRFRTRDLIDQPVDTQVRLRDGTAFAGIDGLRSYILQSRRDDFLEQFCGKLLGFALGRAVELSDRPLIEEMVKQLAEKDYRFSAAIETIIRSQQFRYHRGLESTREESI
jgi:hypothetical protein